LLIIKDGKRMGYEIKHAESPKATRSVQIAIEDLRLDSLTVIYPGERSFALTEAIRAMPVREVPDAE
jgi:uncharacterized protein